MTVDVLLVDIRETQARAIQECERLNPVYAKIDGRFVAGRHYYKRLHE